MSTPSTGSRLGDTALALLTAGGGKYAWDAWREYRQRRAARPTADQRIREDIDANILTVARARDELAEDNGRLRETLREERAQHASTLREEREQHDRERQSWWGEREQLREEITLLETQLRAERDEHNRRYDALLEQLADLRHRHGI